jgi:hypothetical protein
MKLCKIIKIITLIQMTFSLEVKTVDIKIKYTFNLTPIMHGLVILVF